MFTADSHLCFRFRRVLSYGVRCIIKRTLLSKVGVLGQQGETWSQWLLEDSGRAELPLTRDNQERYPCGMALDLTSQKPTSVNDTVSPPSPLLHVLSTDGLLCSYYCVSTRPGAAPLTSPPQQLAVEGKRPGTIKLHIPDPPAPVAVIKTPHPDVLVNTKLLPSHNLFLLPSPKLKRLLP